MRPSPPSLDSLPPIISIDIYFLGQTIYDNSAYNYFALFIVYFVISVNVYNYFFEILK